MNPTLGLEIGVTHTFLQFHDHNYYHPLGFAYYPDGDHAGLDELEPSIPPPDSGRDCGETMTCPAPMYFLNGQHLGYYSNDPDVLPPITNKTYFGLDDYEPRFYYPFDQWLGLGKFSVNLRFDQDYNRDIFYFCHVRVCLTTDRCHLLLVLYTSRLVLNPISQCFEHLNSKHVFSRFINS